MPSVADRINPLLQALLGRDAPVRLRCWDGSETGSGDVAIILHSPYALRRILYSPDELGFARAYVSGDLDVEGNIFDLLALRDSMGARTEHVEMKFRSLLPLIFKTARSVGALGKPLPAPNEEFRSRGRLHGKKRDEASISHHYDVSNDFYRLVLGASMTYSCAYFPTAETHLGQAQDAKHELVCRKLGLREGMRLLDVGCGWGSMVMHAARNHGVTALGITLSHEQAELAAKRVAEAGLEHRIEIRLQDYRDVADGPFDAISSIGMFEHVGARRLGLYLERLRDQLAPGGRLLNHAISRPSGPASFDKRSFISRYVFPDGELLEVGRVVSAMQDRGLEVRDVESLREHYATTLRRWVANLESSWEEAVALAGLPMPKIWRLYMAGSALGFDAGRINVHQVLAVKPDEGDSRMPRTRSSFVQI